MSSAVRLANITPWTLDLVDGLTQSVDSACIGVGEAATAQHVLNYACHLDMRHVVQKQGHEFARELQVANRLIESPELLRYLPASTILRPNDPSESSERQVMLLQESFNSSKQKRSVLTNLSTAIEIRGLAQSINEDVILIADELFTNAVYNAPFVDPVTSVNPGIDRHTAEVLFDGDKAGRIFVAVDQSRLVIGCADPFGSLNLRKWLLKIRETYLRGPAATMNFGPGGAGLGSYIIFNTGTSLYFGNWPGELTMLCCVLPLGMSNRKRMQLPKHLNWIQG